MGRRAAKAHGGVLDTLQRPPKLFNDLLAERDVRVRRWHEEASRDCNVALLGDPVPERSALGELARRHAR
jgi:hypothetical protein